MKKINFSFSYLFVIFAFIIMILTILSYAKFETTKNKIIEANLRSNIEYVAEITDSYSKFLKDNTKGDIYNFLKNNKEKRVQFEKYLQMFITKRFKYFYVVTKDKKRVKLYRFLLDGSKNENDKSEFNEMYEPLNQKKWDKVFKTKKPLYFKHHKLKNLWITYLKPVIRDGKVEAVIVVDFAMKYHQIITQVLKNLDQVFEISFSVFVFIFFAIIVFAYLDLKREQQKDAALSEIEKMNHLLEIKIKKAVEENRKKDQAIFQQSRLAQMGEMLSMIAHQWRQPLSAISSTATALKLKVSLHDVKKEFIVQKSDKIIEYSKHLSSTIDDFRNFFKDNKKETMITLCEIVESVLDIVTPSLENKNIKLEKKLYCKRSFLSLSNELRQVVLNLIKNAEDALVEHNISEPCVCLETFEDDIFAYLKVKDNAGGIPKDIIDKIFDPYFSTKTKKDGTGLGLYMSKVIVEDHCSGELSVENGNDGAIFTIKLKLKG